MIQPNSNNLVGIEDLKKVVDFLLKHWYLFIIFTLAAGLVAFLYTHRLTETYASRAQILLDSGETYDYQSQLYQGLGYYNSYATFEKAASQVRVLRSSNLVNRALDKLNLEVSYFILGRLKIKEVYGGTPFSVTKLRGIEGYANLEFKVNVLNVDSFRLSYELDNVEQSKNYRFGDLVADNRLYFTVERSPNLSELSVERFKKTDYMFRTHRRDQLISRYQSALDIVNIDYTSILEVTVNDRLAERASAFLDTLSQEYIKYTLENKIEVNENTLQYIDKQLDEVTTIMATIETELQSYKESEDILNLSKEENAYFDELIRYETDKRQLEINIQSIEALEDYILENYDKELLPPSFFIIETDDFLKKSINNLYELNLERNERLVQATDRNLKIREKDDQINNLRASILVYLNNSKNAFLSGIQTLQSQIDEYEGRIKSIPRTQRQILNIQRRLLVYEELYSFLLSKRAETVIARAGIVPETKVIEPARSIGLVGPNKNKIIGLFLLGGLALAVSLAFLRHLFFERIESVQQLSQYTNLPILGGLPFKKGKEPAGYMVLQSNPKGIITDSFRHIRTNLQYFASHRENQDAAKIILITSILPGEGKTFCSVNLSTILSMANKRVLLIDFDLHKPKVGKALEMETEVGLSSLLIGKSRFDEVQFQSPIDNLMVIPSGPVPPNASELILNGKVDDLLDEARKHYDYIVVDTPPLSLITDGMVLMQKVDLKLFVLNSKFTNRQSVNFIEDAISKNDLTDCGIILNGVRQRRFSYYYYGKYGYGYGYGYGFGYGYGYGYRGYGYGENEEKKK
ncbi:MAG: GumC family protein [Salibacteraceae bacterium]